MYFSRILILLALTSPLSLMAAEQMQTIVGELPTSEVPETEAAPEGGDFTLQSADGDVHLSDYKGKAVILFFGYTSCPDICPTALFTLSSTLDLLSEDELAQTQAMFISLDPKRDAPAILKEYAEHYSDHILGVTSSEQNIKKVADQYGVKYYQVKLEDSGMDYAVNHSAGAYLINKQGDIQFIFPHDIPPNVFADGVRYILKN